MTRLPILGLALSVACSSSYLPQSRGRVAMTMRDGKLVYVRDGRIYEPGVLGGGLAEVVAGNPAAMAAASEYHSRVSNGLLGVVVGAVAGVTGAAWMGTEVATTPNPSVHDIALPLTLAVAGIVVELIGAGYVASAEPYRWDAINLFNDGAGLPPPGAPGAGPTAKATLRMRDE